MFYRGLRQCLCFNMPYLAVNLATFISCLLLWLSRHVPGSHFVIAGTGLRLSHVQRDG